LKKNLEQLQERGSIKPMNSVKKGNIDNFGFQHTHLLSPNFISLAIRTHLLGIFGEQHRLAIPPSARPPPPCAFDNVIPCVAIAPVPVIVIVVCRTCYPYLPILSRAPRSTNNHPYRRDLIVVVGGTRVAPGGGRARVIPGEEVGQSRGRGAWAELWACEGEARTTSGRGGRAVSGGGG
jgi:hypothetical protein